VFLRKKKRKVRSNRSVYVQTKDYSTNPEARVVICQ